MSVCIVERTRGYDVSSCMLMQFALTVVEIRSVISETIFTFCFLDVQVWQKELPDLGGA